MSSPKPPSNSDPTLITPSPAPAPSQSPLSPGSTLANRYRIITQLGKGGMGEVYRADDLELGASVALKLLPPQIAADPISVDRFRAEVRLARQISHPNIVRVYDIVIASGMGILPMQPPPLQSPEDRAAAPPSTLSSPPLIFLSMEYVDGEDLNSLLRRIGRLPQDKAVQIARQLCFGLAAAHDQGVIHRDLKPANIMIDGRGNARIMDFGVAGIAAQLMAAGDITSGTPAYMAPEQLAGKEISRKSDLYSLGLVLYELFTGKPAFVPPISGSSTDRCPPQMSLSDLRKLHASSTRPESLSRHVADLDPAIERIILRCLEPDPADRPASAIAIAAALPGGDPLAAALAAGETPSPELIAASGQSQTISPAQAWGRAGIIAAFVVAFMLLTSSWSMVAQVKPAKSPEVLQDRAIEIARALGYADPPADSARGFASRDQFIQMVNLDKAITNKIDRLRSRPGPYEFWYRQSPQPIESARRNGTVGALSPIPAAPGELVLRSDTSGRLESIIAIASRRRADNAQPVSDSTVARLFEFAALDSSRFTPATPIFRSFAPFDSARSWTGSLSDQPDLPIRVHLGEADGKVTYFSVAYPWTVAAMEAKPQPPQPKSIFEYAAGAILAIVLIGTCRIVYLNLRSGRGDRTSALRLALVVFLFSILFLLFSQHTLPTFRSILMLGGSLAAAGFAAIEFWFFYIAVEPYARRAYPQALVSWSRLLRGAWNDPLVGRHILTGLLLGTFSALCTGLFAGILRQFVWQSPAIAFYGATRNYLGGYPGISAMCADAFVSALLFGTGTLLPVVIGQVTLKRRWTGYVVLLLALTAMSANSIRENPVEGIADVLIGAIPILAIRPGGLLALVTAHLAIFLCPMLPIGLDWSHWFTAPALIPAAILAALTILAARAASAGRSVSL